MLNAFVVLKNMRKKRWCDSWT